MDIAKVQVYKVFVKNKYVFVFQILCMCKNGSQNGSAFTLGIGMLQNGPERLS